MLYRHDCLDKSLEKKIYRKPHIPLVLFTITVFFFLFTIIVPICLSLPLAKHLNWISSVLAQKSLNYEHMLHTQNGMSHEVMPVLFRVTFYNILLGWICMSICLLMNTEHFHSPRFQWWVFYIMRPPDRITCKIST